MMKYFTEISNLVRGALVKDEQVVSAYTQQLIEKLTSDGEVLAAKGLTEQLSKSKSNSTMIGQKSVSFSRPVPVEKDNRFELADRTHPQLEESIVFLPDNLDKKVNAFVSYLGKKDELNALNIPINPTLLLFGPPGTGKSKLAANIAARVGLPLVTARADALISSYLGSTSKNIRSLMEYAKSEPCVLFLDEFDSIAKARDDKNEIGELKRVVVSLLQNIDTLKDTIVIAATNHAHLLDPAIGRRFHYKMELLPPLAQERSKIFESLLLRFTTSKADLATLASISEGMTGAEIEIATFEYLRSMIVEGVDYSSYDLMKSILSAKYHWLDFNSDTERSANMFKLKQLNSELYTGKLLGLLWNVTPSYVSRLIKDHK
ncbi:TPA: ATP-binding protein [Vibrio parahaemolyticus]|nr:ATP-binding protein [Vibrio parahaemolyticus]HCH2104876.1 ATP-binding protein [Vibrio parahaemolyticus]